MDYIKEHYRVDYAPNTRKNFCSQVLHQLIQSRIAAQNPFEPNLPTNSLRAHYAITEAALEAVRHYGTNRWDAAVAEFQREHGTLSESYKRERERNLVPVRLSDGQELRLSPGRHNEVQRAVVEQFVPRFAPGARLLYLGDTAKKNLFIDESGLAELGITLTDHDKLPDLVPHDTKRNWLFVVEAVTSHGPITPKRIIDLKKLLAECPVAAVYVSAFPDFGEFRKHMKVIAWETEVWLCDAPTI